MQPEAKTKKNKTKKQKDYLTLTLSPATCIQETRVGLFRDTHIHAYLLTCPGLTGVGSHLVHYTVPNR